MGGRGPAISSVGSLHVVISDNVVRGDNVNETGISVSGTSTDVSVHGNNVRGFATKSIAVDDTGGKSDRIQIRGNSIDVTDQPNANGVWVASSTKRVIVADNVVTGSTSADSCVLLEGSNSSTRT